VSVQKRRSHAKSVALFGPTLRHVPPSSLMSARPRPPPSPAHPPTQLYNRRPTVPNATSQPSIIHKLNTANAQTWLLIGMFMRKISRPMSLLRLPLSRMRCRREVCFSWVSVEVTLFGLFQLFVGGKVRIRNTLNQVQIGSGQLD